jgi:PhnB protein
MSTPRAPEGYNTVNPFVITENASELIAFLVEVFGAEEVPDARTIDVDSLLLHAELRIGDSIVMLAERKPGWPVTPGLLQVYVDDVDAALETARGLGATVVTEPTEFFGARLSRFVDPWRNLWWVYEQSADAPTEWSDEDWDQGTGGDSEEWSSDELRYINETLTTAMRMLGSAER